jgi:septum formation protein
MALSLSFSNTNFRFLRQLATQYELVLGSSSPRRLQLLGETGVPFTQKIPALEEERLPHEPPFEYALRLARDKAARIGERSTNHQAILGCDTVVALGDETLEKPVDPDDAFRILSTLSGRKHVVCTGLALFAGGRICASDYELTDVLFSAVTPQQIRDYIVTGEPMDKAGAYGIQGMGAFLVDSINGNLDNVVGLPRQLLERLAHETLRSLKLCN